jgi:pimeloyl-ACP methyl ester carboxylesterase
MDLGDTIFGTHHHADINGVRLHYVEAGTGPLVILLHGFPEFWYSWRHQITALSSAGFRVIAPDMRGYNESEKPRGVRNYHIDLLADDVAGLVRHAGEKKAAVVGHDWGGAVAWHTAMRHPKVVKRLAVLNCPHPAVFLRKIWGPSQLRRSWYIFFFQLPWLPEWWIRRLNFAGLEQLWTRDPVWPDAFSARDIAAYKEALGRPGALTATINYYRSMFRRSPFTAKRQMRVIEVPTLLIWGERDRHLGLHLVDGTERRVQDLRIERLPDASHWVQNDAPERVNALLLGFLQEGTRLH